MPANPSGAPRDAARPGERAERTHPVLSCRGLTKRFGAVQAVDDVGFAIAPGETYGLLGPNGAGMEEAERLCDRIGIMDLGRLQAEGTREELVALVGQHDRVRLQAAGDVAGAARACAGLAGVVTATPGNGEIELIVDEARSLLPELLHRAAEAGASVGSVDVDEPDLEAVFLHLTGRALRD